MLPNYSNTQKKAELAFKILPYRMKSTTRANSASESTNRHKIQDDVLKQIKKKKAVHQSPNTITTYSGYARCQFRNDSSKSIILSSYAPRPPRTQTTSRLKIHQTFLPSLASEANTPTACISTTHAERHICHKSHPIFPAPLYPRQRTQARQEWEGWGVPSYSSQTTATPCSAARLALIMQASSTTDSSP